MSVCATEPMRAGSATERRSIVFCCGFDVLLLSSAFFSSFIVITGEANEQAVVKTEFRAQQWQTRQYKKCGRKRSVKVFHAAGTAASETTVSSVNMRVW